MRLFRKDGDASDSEAAEASTSRGLRGKVRRFFGTRPVAAGTAVGAGTRRHGHLLVVLVTFTV